MLIVVCWLFFVCCSSFVVVVVYQLMFVIVCFWCVLCVDGGVVNVVLFVCCRSLCGVRWLFGFNSCLLCVALSGVFAVACGWLLFVVCELLVVWRLVFCVRWVLFVVCCAL